jgi:uncharacterized membrane protein YbhN (UPF0104 family)
MAIASVLTDFLLQAFGQALFALVGAILLAGLIGGPVMIAVGCAMVAAIIALGGTYGLLRNPGAHLKSRVDSASKCFLGPENASDLPIHKACIAIWSRRRAVATATTLHALTWFIGMLEVWVAMQILGHPAGVRECLILQSLAYAIRTIWFAIPAGLGVQEGGFILIGHWLGIAPDVAIAVSLACRVPDLVLGVPGLAAWYLLEARRARRSVQYRNERAIRSRSRTTDLSASEVG